LEGNWKEKNLLQKQLVVRDGSRLNETWGGNGSYTPMAK